MSSIADPRVLLRHEIRRAVSDTTAAIETQYRSEYLADYTLAGSKRRYDNAFGILAATRAVALYKASNDRIEELKRHRVAQRTAERRTIKPPTRTLRRVDEWEGSPRIPQLNAEELSTHRADELLSLMWLSYFLLEVRKPFDRQLLKLLGPSLLAVYDDGRDLAHVTDALRNAIRRWEKRVPSTENLQHYKIDPFDPDPAEHAARAIFKKWMDGINEVWFGSSGRPKSRPTRI